MAADDQVTQPGFRNEIQGNKKSYYDQMLKVQAAQISTIYESKEAAVGVVADANIRAQAGFGTLFDTVKIAYRVIIRTDQDVLIRVNSVTNDQITINANVAYDASFLETTSIFITTTVGTNVKVILA